MTQRIDTQLLPLFMQTAEGLAADNILREHRFEPYVNGDRRTAGFISYYHKPTGVDTHLCIHGDTGVLALSLTLRATLEEVDVNQALTQTLNKLLNRLPKLQEKLQTEILKDKTKTKPRTRKTTA